MAKALLRYVKEFGNSLRAFLEVCEENGISPTKEFSGKFNLRINPKSPQ
ncbi:MAG: toxin-antitoxin system HicB family antitoxin [Arenicella sp.]|nr:toxin-antitoxin system HicB family antitoxin [Arenicella sp.]